MRSDRVYRSLTPLMNILLGLSYGSADNVTRIYDSITAHDSGTFSYDHRDRLISGRVARGLAPGFSE
jgi:hypothetical protein